MLLLEGAGRLDIVCEGIMRRLEIRWEKIKKKSTVEGQET